MELIQAKIEIINMLQLWQLISVIQLILIIILIVKLKKKNKPVEVFEKEILKGGKVKKMDMDDLMNDIYKSKAFYESLIRKVHPNRFAPDEELMKIADEISAEVGQFKNNYSKLLELESKAIKLLNLK